MWALSKLALWFASKTQKKLHRDLPMIDKEAIFLVKESAVVLSARISALE